MQMGEFLVTDDSNFRLTHQFWFNSRPSRFWGSPLTRLLWISLQGGLDFRPSQGLRPETPQWKFRGWKELRLVLNFETGEDSLCYWYVMACKIMAEKSFLRRFKGASQKPTNIFSGKKIKEKVVLNISKQNDDKKRVNSLLLPQEIINLRPFKAVESLSRPPAVGPFALGPGSWLDQTCQTFFLLSRIYI